MAAGTIERERGDDRDPAIAEQKLLEEMFNQASYVSDTPNAAAGEYAPVVLHKDRPHQLPAQIGRITFRQVHITPSEVFPEISRN